MTTATQVREASKGHPSDAGRVAFFQAGSAGPNITTSVNDKGNTVVSGLRIFRSGTFKDSMGTQHTWRPEHLDQMVVNFNLLNDLGILPNVPIREGHPSLFGGGGHVKGYITGLTTEVGTPSVKDDPAQEATEIDPTDPESTTEDSTETSSSESAEQTDDSGEDTCTFLVADFEFTEPDGAEKYARGTYRGRSSEVGLYESNDGGMYFPVVMGLAFVDIPAVEGLYEKENPKGQVILLEESSLTQPATPAVPGANVHTFTIGGQPTTDFSKVQAHIAALEKTTAEPQLHTFSIGGHTTTDYAKVQAHVAALEGFKTEAMTQGRKDFIKKLATDGKVLASNLSELETEVLAMDDTSYGAFQVAMKYTMASSVLAPVASGVSNPMGTDGNHGISAVDDQIDIRNETIASFSRLGWTQERIQSTTAYKELQGLLAQKSAQV